MNAAPRLNVPPFTPIAHRDDLPAHATAFLPAGANLVITPELERLLNAARTVMSNRRLISMPGAPGCGKSTAQAVLAAACSIKTTTCVVPTVKHNRGLAFYAALHSALIGTEALGTQREHENAVHRILSEEPRVLLIDEAQNADFDVLCNLRLLLERPNMHFTVVLSGTGITELLEKYPMLLTWRQLTIDFQRLVTPMRLRTARGGQAHDLARASQLIPTLHGLHHRLARTDETLLVETDRVHCHGLIRSWIALLENLLSFSPDSDEGFSRTELIDAIVMVTNRTPPFRA